MNAFDRILWRINGVLLLLTVLGVGVLMVYVVGASGLVSQREHNADVVLTTNESQKKSYLHLGSGSLLAGGRTLRFPLYDSESDAKFSSGYGRMTRNYLFVDPASLNSWWLLPEHTGIIAGYHDLYVPTEGAQREVISTVYEVMSRDTNGDGRIDGKDKVSALLSANDGSPAKTLAEESRGILAVEATSDTEALITFQTDKDTKVLVFEKEGGALVREGTLSMEP